jgi:outer membrane receptor protein involved in Fe transport
VLAQSDDIEEVVSTAARSQLLGVAATSSQGLVEKSELDLLPAFRPGALLETVPGLTVTSHSGEGKANQYLLRGFNLDHGTDLGIFYDGMPVNETSHAHGQGYSDLNFIIPEAAAGVDFTKGPYFASEGDFSSVGAVHTRLVDMIADQVTVTGGTLGYQRVFGAASRLIGEDTLMGMAEFVHYDGPWVNPDNLRKVNALLRYVHGDEANGFNVSGMFYRGSWNATTDQPERAITAGLITRYGSLDPTDGGESMRMSLTAQYHADLGDGHLDANAYIVNNRLTLINNFTHFLDDPVHGDQESQNEARGTFGGVARYRRMDTIAGIDNELLLGVSDRLDQNHVYRNHTEARAFLSNFEDDHLHVNDFAAYAEATTHWTPWLRTVLGVREEDISGGDIGTNTGHASQSLFQPKGNIAVTPLDWLEVYVSAGQGFHSDDLRGVTQAASSGVAGAPLIAKQVGEEVGLRANILPSLTATLTYFYLKSQSETTYDPDAGQDGAGPGSRRTGFELNTTWQATSWLEFYTSLAVSHARYTEITDDGAGGHLGTWIPNAPNIIGSLAAYVKNLGPWTGGLEYRYLGAFPVTPDDMVEGKGYGEWNLEGAHAFDNGWKLGVGVYNLLDTKADAAAFWYADRLPGEPAAGVSDLHVHPIEPLTVRFTLSRAFH